jgi:hypothetical protein
MNLPIRELKTKISVSLPFVLFLSAIINLAGSVCSATVSTPSATTNAPASSGSDSASAAPLITSQPNTQAVNQGQAATFVVVATGAAPLTYQWMRNGADIAGATSPSYTTPAAAVEDNGARFSVKVSNSFGSITSDITNLTVYIIAPREQPASFASLEDQRGRYSRFLSNSYIGVQVGSIGYAFSNAQLQPGFQAQSVKVPHLAGRFVLFGHEFNKYLSGQISEIIPAHGVAYQNVNGTVGNHYLWADNIAGFTVKARLPLRNRWSLYGEGGLGVVTRNGFTVKQSTALNGANYATFLYGGGLDYRLNEHWNLLTGVTVAPGESAGRQPTTVFFSGGFDYTMRRVPEEPAAEESPDAPIWPRNFVQFGTITNALGYGVNDFFTKGKVAIFWHGTVEVANGLSVDYQRNIFHARRFFALDWGASISSWRSRIEGQRFFTASVYPVLRFPLVRTNPAEIYFSYSLAGLALVTRTNIDAQNTGRVFTFQDYMALGTYLGRKRRFTGEVRIGHYSNANLFSRNPGITIPLGFYFGTTF